MSYLLWRGKGLCFATLIYSKQQNNTIYFTRQSFFSATVPQRALSLSSHSLCCSTPSRPLDGSELRVAFRTAVLGRSSFIVLARGTLPSLRCRQSFTSKKKYDLLKCPEFQPAVVVAETCRPILPREVSPACTSSSCAAV